MIKNISIILLSIIIYIYIIYIFWKYLYDHFPSTAPVLVCQESVPGPWFFVDTAKGTWEKAIFWIGNPLFLWQWIGLREHLYRKPMGFYHQI